MAYRSVDSALVTQTIEKLRRRIEERFPKRGLVSVCDELLAVANKDCRRVAELARPYFGVRVAVAGIALLLTLSLFYLAKDVKVPSLLRLLQPGSEDGAMLTLFQGIDSAVNVIVFFGLGLFFLLRHEERRKRRLALEDLYELRAIAHIIDMHQLPKDPMTTLFPEMRTAASGPADLMTPFELSRYLDYCSEMLSLVAKVGALYAQDSRDPIVIASVSDLDSMTTNLSRKIWQKISIIEQLAGGAANGRLSRVE